MSQGQALPVYGDGSSQRDYTYVDDIVDGIVRAWHWLQQGVSDRGVCEIFNLGGSHPVLLRDLIHLLEVALGYQAELDWQPMQPGDVPITCADVKKSHTILGFQPQVDIETGLQRFAAWFLPRVSASSP
jgi:UDP-glucuronate 4-epimerase